MSTRKSRARIMSDREIVVRLTEMENQEREIIRLQSKVIDTLFSLLSLHISSEELDKLPCIEDINAAAELRREMEGL